MILVMTLFIYFIHFAFILVNHQVDQRSHENEMILIADVMFIYLTCYTTKFWIDEAFDDHIVNESSTSIAKFSHDPVHLFCALESRDSRKINLLRVIGQMNDHHQHQYAL